MGPITRLLQRALAARNKQQKREVAQASRQLSNDIAIRLNFRPAQNPDVEALKLAIIAAASGCLKFVESRIQSNNGEDASAIKFLIHCEFFSFFTYLANRLLLADFGVQTAERWEEQAGLECISEFLDTAVKGWNQAVKGRMQQEIYCKIGACDGIYGLCEGLMSKENDVFAGEGMFNKLGCRVAKLAGIDNPVVQLTVTMTAASFYMKLKFQERVQSAAGQLTLQRAVA